MTDKQIIIDNIDVSRCEYIIPPHKQCPNKPMPYAKETSCFACKEHNTKLNFCKNNPNCNYKNWQRKEQECENWKKYGCFYLDKFIQFKQTLDEIKVFIQKEIEYFDHDPEYQYDWKELMGLIKASEVDGESYLDNHWLFTENKKGEN